MLADVFQIIASNLNAYISEAQGVNNHPEGPIIKLLQQDNDQEYVKFPLNNVTPLLINIEEEGHLRQADRFSRVSVNGNREPIFPDLRLYLYILFVSHFQEYSDTLNYLSLIVKYFQTHPVLDHQNTPRLHEDIEKLIVQLQTLPLAEQNEVWNALRSAYRPSLLYRVNLVVFQDKPAVAAPGVVKEVESVVGELD